MVILNLTHAYIESTTILSAALYDLLITVLVFFIELTNFSVRGALPS